MPPLPLLWQPTVATRTLVFGQDESMVIQCVPNRVRPTIQSLSRVGTHPADGVARGRGGSVFSGRAVEVFSTSLLLKKKV